MAGMDFLQEYKVVKWLRRTNEKGCLDSINRITGNVGLSH